MNRILSILVIITVGLFSFGAEAKNYKVDEVPNVNVANKYQFVSDPDGYLTSEQRETIDKQLYDLRDKTTGEMAVVILSDIEGDDVFDYGMKLAEKWGIGKKDNSNGLLLLFVMDRHETRFFTGYGLEGVLPDITLKRIIDNKIIPNMKEDNLYGAVNDAVSTVNSILTDPEAAAEIASKESDEGFTAADKEILWNLIYFVGIATFILNLILFIHDARIARKSVGSNYEKSLVWRKHLILSFILGIFSIVGLIFWALSLMYYRHQRTRKQKCDICGHKMDRLPEDKDNDYLTSSQDCEEQLNTVDYDVWLCPDCGAVKIFPYKVNQSHYKPCPKCGAIAYALKYEKTIIPATTFKEGLSESVYECHHCGNSDIKHNKIPKKDSAVGAAALGAAAMAGSRSSGVSIGGGFGGGSFGGGGAGGRW
jgi:uncharacterized protein